MTLKELLEKNAAIKAQREAEAQAIAEEAKKQEAINTKKKGKKPANRAYLVVEPISEPEEAVLEETTEEVVEEKEEE